MIAGPVKPNTPVTDDKSPGAWWERYQWVWRRFWVCVGSILLVIVLPMLPMVLEALNHEGNIQTDSILLTTAILAAGFLLTAGGPAFLTGYGLMFGWALLIVYGEAKVVAAASNAAPKLADPIPDLQSQDWGVILRFETWNLSHPMVLFVFVCVLQIIERVIWHIADDKPIFEKLKRS